AVISNPCWSMVKVPNGFPQNPDKWSVIVVDRSTPSQSNPVDNTWYNLGSISISIPIGLWRVQYYCVINCATPPAATPAATYVTLSTSNNNESNNKLTYFSRVYTNNSSSLKQMYET